MKIKVDYLGQYGEKQIDLEYAVLDVTITHISDPEPPMSGEYTKVKNKSGKYVTARYINIDVVANPESLPESYQGRRLYPQLRHTDVFFKETVLPALGAHRASEVVGKQISVLYKKRRPIGIVPNPEEATLGDLL